MSSFRHGPAVAAAVIALVAGAAGAHAAPAKWTVDKATSRLGFRAAFAGQAVRGTFRRWDADIAFDPKALATSKATVTVQTASAVTGDPSKDQALPTADWFDVAHFPRATFATTAIKDLGGGRYQATGTLSLRGASRPIILPFTLTITGGEAKMIGSAVVNRSAFGVGQGQFKDADTVPFNVAIEVALTAHKAK
jgi:polyisoprenoid-binding protein YceI